MHGYLDPPTMAAYGCGCGPRCGCGPGCGCPACQRAYGGMAASNADCFDPFYGVNLLSGPGYPFPAQVTYARYEHRDPQPLLVSEGFETLGIFGAEEAFDKQMEMAMQDIEVASAPPVRQVEPVQKMAGTRRLAGIERTAMYPTLDFDLPYDYRYPGYMASTEPKMDPTMKGLLLIGIGGAILYGLMQASK